MIPFFKKVFNDLDFRHFGGFSPKIWLLQFWVVMNSWHHAKYQQKKKLKSQFQSWFIRANQKSELVSQQEMTYYFQVSCVCACVVRVCGGGKKEGGARILNTARQTNFKIFKREAFFWNRIFSLLVFVL